MKKKKYTKKDHTYQTSVNQGPHSRFVLEAIIKALISSKSSWSSILKTLYDLHPIHDFQLVCPSTLIVHLVHLGKIGYLMSPTLQK